MIPLSEGFSLIPEGEHVFKITKVVYKEEYGKLEITMTTANGQSHIERFSLVKSNGEINQGAINAFSYFAKTALGDFSRTEIDEQELVDCYLRCTVKHEEVESKKKPGTFVTFVRLTDKAHADGYDEDNTPPAQENKPTPQIKPGFDLSSLLG